MKKSIEKDGRVTKILKEELFKGKSVFQIRNSLEQMGLDRHMPIELYSTEVAIITPKGILMQIRKSDNNQLGLWGGVINDYETPIEGAIRELREETGIDLPEESFDFVETNTHEHVYANGDKVIFTSYRYIVKLDYVPDVNIDKESVGIMFVQHTILSHQQEFIKRILGGKV